MRHLTKAPCATAFLLVACSSGVQTVSWYEEHLLERVELLKKCDDNPGQLRPDPNCINAREAQAKYLASPEFRISSQVTEACVLADPVKASVQDYYNHEGRLPTSNAVASISEDLSGLYVDRVAIFDSGILAHFGANAALEIRGEPLVFVPSLQDGSIKWRCEGLERKYIPSYCGFAPEK